MMNKKNYIHLGLDSSAGISAKIVCNTAELVLICTHSESRGKGYASLLLSHLVEILREKGVTLLYVENYLESAKSWYLTHGFVENDLALELEI